MPKQNKKRPRVRKAVTATDVAARFIAEAMEHGMNAFVDDVYEVISDMTKGNDIDVSTINAEELMKHPVVTGKLRQIVGETIGALQYYEEEFQDQGIDPSKD